MNDDKTTIIETANFERVQELCAKLDSEDWILLDVDEVLLMPSDQTLRHKEAFNNKFSEVLLKLKTEKRIEGSEAEIISMMGALFAQRKAKPVDPGFIHLTKELQDRGVRIIALTNSMTDSIGQVQSMKQWRLDELNSLGYLLGASWPNTPEKKFENLPTEQKNIYPVFDKGVLFTNGVPKGQVLEAFVKHYSSKPKGITFIDDKKDYVESVQQYAEKAGINFLGIHYTAVKAHHMPAFNDARAALQVESLVTEKKWLSDAEADEKLSKAQ